jgi:hypothetical protein
MDTVYVRNKIGSTIYKIGSTKNIYNRMMNVKTEFEDFSDLTHNLWTFTFDSLKTNNINCYDVDEFIKQVAVNGVPFNKYNGSGGTEFYEIDTSDKMIAGINDVFNFLKIKSTFEKESVCEVINNYTKQKDKVINKANDKVNKNSNKINPLMSKLVTLYVNNKCYMLLRRPCQSGKTFCVIELIKKTNVINVVFCDNSLLQINQTKLRMQHNGLKCIEISSKSKNKKIKSIVEAIKNDNINVVLACGNYTQMKKIEHVIKQLDRNFMIWIDEADKVTCCEMSMYSVFEYRTMDNVKQITFVTATPQKLYSMFDPIVDISKKPISKNYQYIKESHIIAHKQNKNLPEFVENILKDNLNKSKKGQVWFVPAKAWKKHHYGMADLLIQYGFTVMIINSDGLTIKSHDKNKKYDKVTNLSNKKLSDIISDIYQKHKLNKEKVAITGKICIGRGITISSPNMVITHAILGHNKMEKNTLYQLAGRICGNTKNFPLYKRPIIHCTKAIKENMLKYEGIANM